MEHSTRGVDREIWRLALPNIASNLSVPILSSVDTALMGYLSPLHIAAVGAGSMVLGFLYWNFGFLRMSTTGLTARAYGASDAFEIGATLWRGLLLGLTIAVLILIFRHTLAQWAFRFMHIQEDLRPHIEQYFYIRLWAAPATLSLYVLFGWFFGLQNAIYPLLLTVVGNLINIVVSAVLVLWWDLETAGVAWGTVVAQYCSLALAALLSLRYRPYFPRLSHRALYTVRALHHFMRINTDIFLRTALLTFVFAWVHRYASLISALYLAATVVIMQFLNWMSFALDGLAYAAESLVGKYAGARHRQLLRRTIQRVFFWSFVMATGFSTVYAGYYESLLHLFTKDAALIEMLDDYRYWVAAMPLLGVAAYVWDGVFIGLTASRGMLYTMLLATVGFFLALYLFQARMPQAALWLALGVFLGLRGAFQTAYFYLKRLDRV